MYSIRARTRVRVVLTAVLVLFASIGIWTPAASASPSFDRSAVLAAMQQLVDYGAPAVVIHAVDASGSWSAAVGVSDLHTGAPAAADAEFRIGSISKMFVAVAVLQLAGEGKIDLDAPVATYLPGLLVRGDIVTIRELLQHRAGLASTAFTQQGWGTVGGVQQACHSYFSPTGQVQAADQQLYPPGTSWNYANAGFIALQLVIEKVTGQSYGQVLHDRIIAPLGLTHTSFQGGAPVWDGPFLHGYGYYLPGKANFYHEHFVDNTDCAEWIFGAAGSGISTTTDLTTFIQAMTHGQLLSPTLYAQMIDAVPVGPDYAYGLGLEQDTAGCGVTVIGHSGGVYGYQSFLLTSQDGSQSIAIDTPIFTPYQFINDLFDNVVRAEVCQWTTGP